MPLPLRILFSFARGQGHLNPLLPFARAARARGHETALAGPRENVAGRADFAPLFPSDTGAARTERGTGRLVVADPRRPYARVEEVFLGEAARTAARSVDDAIADWAPSLVVCDEFDFGAMVAAERAGVPVVVVEVTASAYAGWRPSVAHALDALRAEAGLAPDPGLAMLAGDLLVVPFPESVAGAGQGAASGAEQAPRSVLRVRPEAPETADDHPAVRWLAAGDEPWRVYATLGTQFNTRSGDLLHRILDGLATTEARVLATVGPCVDPATFPGATPRRRLEDYVPQGAVLDRVDVVITHGGSGTVAGALAAGVPLVVLPMGADQRLNGERIAQLGVGRMLDAATATPQEIADAVRGIRDEPSFADAAGRIRDQIAALPPAAEALPAFEALAGR
ncbi:MULTISPECIES: glycosyltransferase [Clavibacter]|uniref:Glycosyltransferase n=2 Tax=Clavibacter TaxID=1573 RepID=A0A399NQY7_9MICO|nr:MULTISPECIES: glycosyltransferase [Clavibacter]KDP92580.1 glycosyl transferase [Clavibacter cf. michiganensis LMG 26808]RII95729.1 glycosyltransferase [Clavibacter michiganensis]UKF25262.1 glycosyltransferase [Clavibacter sp. A6099]